MSNHKAPPNKQAQRNDLIRAIRTEMGLSIQKIADLYGITRQRVQQILGRTGYQATKLGSRVEREQMEREIIRLHQQGLDATSTSKIIGVRREVVYTILHKHNLRVRIEDTNPIRLKSGQRKCYRCKETKSLKEFGRNRAIKDGISNVCKTCNTEHTKKYYRGYRAKP